MTRCRKRTSVEQIESLVKTVALLDLGVTAVHNEGIANQETGMSNSWSRSFSSGGERIARQAASSLDHPKIPLDCRTVDQAAHDVQVALLGGGSIGSGAISRKRAGVRGSEI